MPDDATLPPRLNDDTKPITTPAAEPPALQSSVPGYLLLGELGRGGMGVVYRARQLYANRDVALKMVLAADHAAPSELVRFRTEAEAVARLQHPHIVAVFDVGEHAGRPYFSMELCPGGSLADRLKGTPMLTGEAAGLVLKVARGVAAAHAAGVVHRDLKPGNVLLTGEGEPKVADFGCAKVSGPGDRHLTATGAVVGTPNYMAPEQAGGAKHVGPPADVYALGAILYECLTACPPFRGATPTDVLIQVLTEDPPAPRKLNPNIPRDLEAVCLRCLDKDPLRRYPTAAELAADLERFTLGEPVVATRTGLLKRLVGVVDRVRLQTKFAALGNLLLALAPLMFGSDVVVTVLGSSEYRDPWVIVARGVQAVLFVLLIGYFRGWQYRPIGPAERQLWAVWGGYLLACFAYGLIGWSIAGNSIRRGLEMYPGFACLTALAFFTLAPSFWGYCWVIGGGFIGLAGVMLLDIEWAPYEFGLAWGVVLVTMGLRLKTLARKG